MTTQIQVTNDIPVPSFGFADFFDGRTAAIRRVEVKIADGGTAEALCLSLPDGSVVHWPLAGLRAVPDQAAQDEMVLSLTNDPVSRLVVKDLGLRMLLAARCPALRRRPPVTGKKRLLVWTVAALASVALIILVLVPVMANQLAEFLPPDGEKALGDATFEQIRSALNETGVDPLRICQSSAGSIALDKMNARLTAQLDLPYPVQVTVLNHPLINAFALPGGRVVFFRGLIDAAETPDEVAAVLAHEIGHVAHRDPTRIALRSAGSIGVLGLLLGDFAGGTIVLLLTERLIQANYSREAEAGADRFAHDLLAANGIPPSALGSMFRRLKARHGDAEGIVAHFASHPALGDRIARAEAADAALTGAIRPLLPDADWRALRAICG